MLQLARNGADDDPPHCCVKLGGSSSEIPILTCRFLPVVGQTAKPKNCDSFVLYNKGVLEGVKNDWELLLKDVIVTTTRYADVMTVKLTGRKHNLL